jgi:hypothetical protein
MQHSFTTFKYTAMLLLAFDLTTGCNRHPIVYKVTSSHIRACRTTPRDSCEPFILERSSASQSMKVITDNLVTKESSLYQDEKEKAEYGEPATIAYLLDTATSRLYMEGVVAAKSLKPIRSDRATYERGISLDLTIVPDGEYAIAFSWNGSEWDSPCKLIIKTMKLN